MDNYNQDNVNTIEFATFVGWMTKRFDYAMDKWDVADLLGQVKRIYQVPTPEPVVAIYPCADKVTELLNAMANGRKVDAIRSYRALTGDGLKESKDMVENALSQKFAHSSTTAQKPYIASEYSYPTVNYEKDHRYDTHSEG